MRPWPAQLALAGLTTASSYHDGAGVLAHVNPLVGTRGFTPNDNGGMIPSVSPPFGMTRWTPQTRENYISQVPYSDHDRRLHGFQATHQPAIWMGESGQVVLTPGTGDVIRTKFEQRGLSFRKEDEKSTAYVYEILLDADSVGEAGWNLTEQWASETMGKQCPPCPGGAANVPGDVEEGAGGRVRRGIVGQMPVLNERVLVGNQQSRKREAYDRSIRVAMTASAHVGHLRFDFEDSAGNSTQTPYITIQASRSNWIGSVEIDAAKKEISGSNSQRQDWALGPDRPKSFRGYFVSRFSEPFAEFGATEAGDIKKGTSRLEGKDVGAYATFSKSARRVEVRTGVSFISIEQARRNLDLEIPDGTSFDKTVESVKSAWLEKMDRISIAGANVTDPEHDPLAVFYTGLFHSLQYPSDFSEPTTSVDGGTRRYYSGYTDSVHTEDDSYYQSWSIWDTYRAQHSLLTIFAPERVNSMMRTLLKIFDWSGRLPLWANMVETNIMIATNADAVLANALVRGFRGFNISAAWAAVKKDAYEPPERDTELLYYDREPDTPHEARAGLTSYLAHGWVDNDHWAESASRTLDYAFNDWACASVAQHAGENATAKELMQRSFNYKKIWNNDTQFMQARNSNGSWANDTWGWTEGDKWVYTFDVMHDVGGLASLFDGGKKGMKRKLDEHFAGGHNMHSNEPSHHVPYLYAMLGYPSSTAEQVRSLARSEYNATAAGLSGNEDLGQMSAWYVLSALGFYPVNPASDQYIVGTPFFDEVRIRMPEGPGTKGEHELVISAHGAGTKGWKYIKSLRVDGKKVHSPVLKHADVVGAKKIVFEMSPTKTCWGKMGTV
ncbi:hypothetical protein PWT90_05891 [Aphanocladium album]|nr:hypothetical protein PWT90_05891 [Aphanocladium album]